MHAKVPARTQIIAQKQEMRHLDVLREEGCGAVNELAELVHLMALRLNHVLHPIWRVFALRQAELDLQYRMREVCDVCSLDIPFWVSVPA